MHAVGGNLLPRIAKSITQAAVRETQGGDPVSDEHPVVDDVDDIDEQDETDRSDDYLALAFAAFKDEGDTAAAIAPVTTIDSLLTKLFSVAFLPSMTARAMLDESAGVLAGVKAKADLAYVLGLISRPCFQNIVLLSLIRNRFAHKIVHQGFHWTTFRQDIERLTPPADVSRFMTKAAEFVWRQPRTGSEAEARLDYIVAAVGVVSELVARIEAAEKDPPSAPEDVDNWWATRSNSASPTT